MSAVMLFLLACGLQRESFKGDCFHDGCADDPVSEARVSCDVLEQDCPEGQKCLHAFNDQEGTYEPACVDLIGDGERGDICVQYAEGEDTCGAGMWCYRSRCQTYCATHTQCGDSFCVQAEGDIDFCLDECDPLDDGACAPGMNCVDWGPTYTCAYNIAVGVQGDRCDGDWECDAGYACQDDPDGTGDVCQRRCDLADPVCPGELTCTDAEEGDQPALGFCQ